MDAQKHTGPGVRAEALTIPELEQSKTAVLMRLPQFIPVGATHSPSTVSSRGM
jgi:hypothetical protein